MMNLLCNSIVGIQNIADKRMIKSGFQRVQIRSSLSVIGWVITSSVNATGLGFWEASTSVSALAGAHGASAVDASALSINPSSIAQLDSATVTVAASRYQVDTSYAFVDGALTQDYSTAEVIPAGFFTSPLDDNWHLGLAIYSRNAADITVPSIPFLHPNESNVAPIMVSLAPSIVFAKDNWSIGMTVEYIHSQYSYDYTKCKIFLGCSDYSIQDTTSGWSGGLSGTWQATPWLSVAASHKFSTDFSDPNIDIQLPSVTSLFTTIHATPDLNLHLSYSYSAWTGKGVRYTDYNDVFGLLVGYDDSQRLAGSMEYHLGKLMLMAGASADQAIDVFGGTDVRVRAGLGYSITPNWRLDAAVVSENYSEKQEQVNGVTVVNVQNEGLLLGLGVNYQFN
jgi:long-subunit fatty acid transport protein